MDIISHYSAYTPARTSAASRTGTKVPDAGSVSGDEFLDMVREQGSVDESSKLYNGSPTRASLSDTEIAVLANKYDVRNMSDEEYDAFLDDLESMGAISNYEKTHELGYKGIGYVDLKAGYVEDGVRVMSAWMAPLSSGDHPLLFERQDADGDIFKWLNDRIQWEPSYGKDPDQKKAQKDCVKLHEALAGIVGRMAVRQADDAEAARKAELVRQLADKNSDFYTNMRTTLKAQVDKTNEDEEEQAIIDAFGAVLDALSGKKDASGNKESVNKSATDLTKKIGEKIARLKQEDPNNPEITRLENMLKRLQEIGIYFDLGDMDDLWQDDETFETLTQMLIRRQAEEINNQHPNEKEVNEPA